MRISIIDDYKADKKELKKEIIKDTAGCIIAGAIALAGAGMAISGMADTFTADTRYFDAIDNYEVTEEYEIRKANAEGLLTEDYANGYLDKTAYNREMGNLEQRDYTEFLMKSSDNPEVRKEYYGVKSDVSLPERIDVLAKVGGGIVGAIVSGIFSFGAGCCAADERKRLKELKEQEKEREA